MIKLAIVGYGKMGKEIESILDSETFKLIGKYDIDNKVQDNLKEIPDVAIEFSTPSTVIGNIEFLTANGINVVCGTTGWYDIIDIIKEINNKNNTGFVYARNFSLGVNILFKIIKQTAELMNKYNMYDAAIHETHHSKKLDRPSGTALKLADILLDRISRKKDLQSPPEKPKPDSIDISSSRVGNVFGNHKVIFDSIADTISIEHNAKSRRGFAEGALLAAKFINHKKGFFEFEEIFSKLN